MNILHMSVSAGLLILAIITLRAFVLNKLPKTMFLILWGVTLCRLLIPVSIPLRYSIYSAIGEIAKIVLPDTTAGSVIENVLSMGVTDAGASGITDQIPQAAQGQYFSITLATFIWLAGMLVALTVFAIIYFRNHRELRFALMIRDNDFLNKWIVGHRLLRPITILQSDRITTPVAVGLVKPRIILPKSMNMGDELLLNHVLTHEYYHIKRFDALLKLLCVFALCVHWFNPLVWVMFVLVNRDLEFTCDEAVIRRFGAEAKTAYAYSLIGMAEQRNKFFLFYNGFSRNATEERIVSIMKFKKSSAAAIITAIILVAGTTTAFASSAAPQNNEDSIVSYSFEDENGNINSLDGKNVQQARRIDLTDLGGNVSFTTKEEAAKVNEEISKPRERTEDELKQIIADIESGKIKPFDIASLPDDVTVKIVDSNGNETTLKQSGAVRDGSALDN